MEGHDGGIWSALLSGDLASAKNGVIAIMAGVKGGDWMGQRVLEAVIIAFVSSAATGAMAYVSIIPRLDERTASIQRDIEVRAAMSKGDYDRADRRIDKVENRLDIHEQRLAEELGLIREVLGRMDGRDPHAPAHPRPRRY